MLRESPLILPTPQIWTINDFWIRYKKGEIDFNAEYQRSSIWKKDKKQKLIDSILRNYSIGLIILRKKENKYEVLDGQQRLRTIFEFMENKFSTSGKYTPEFAGKKFEDIKRDPGMYADFIAFKIPYLLIESLDEKKVTEIFLRLQEGLPLNTAEKLNAKLGKMRETIIDLSRYKGFLQSTGIDPRRFAHRLIMAQIFFLEKETRWDKSKPIFPSNITYRELSRMYEDYESVDPPRHVVSRIKRIFNLLKESIDPSVIKKRSDLITIYSLMSYLDRKYVVGDELKQTLRNFVVEFLSKVEKVNTRNFTDEEKDYAQYRINRRRISSPKRFEIMLKYLLVKIPSLRLKDNRREFDYGQKLAIYYKDQGKCQYCGKKVKFNEAHFHHIKSWIDGGLTTVKNGVLMHPSCHYKFHGGTLENE